MISLKFDGMGIYNISSFRKYLESEGYVTVRVKIGTEQINYYAYKDNKLFSFGVYWLSGAEMFEYNISSLKDEFKQPIIKAFSKKGVNITE